MISNPFIVSGNIPEPYFCDRLEETKNLKKTLSNGQDLCLISPRRMGKSKLVKHFYGQAEISDNYHCLYIDLLHTSSLREFVFAFGKCVFDSLQSRSEKIALDFLSAIRSLTATFSIDPISGQPQLGLTLDDGMVPEYTLESIFAYLEKAGRPCIVCFDEFQQIINYPEKNIEALLRSQIQHLSNAHFIFSGSERHLLYRMFAEKSRPFYKSTAFMELEAIAENKYAEFVKYWFEKAGKHIGNDLISVYYSFAEGNTYVLQRISHELYSVVGSSESPDRKVLKTVIDDIIEAEKSRYEHILSMLPERQQKLLFAIAKEDRVEKIMSGSFVNKHRLVSSSVVQNAAKRLLEMDLITIDNKQYSVQDVFFRRYLTQIAEY